MTGFRKLSEVYGPIFVLLSMGAVLSALTMEERNKAAVAIDTRNLHDIGVARQLYIEGYGPVRSVAPLVDAGLLHLTSLQSPSDPTKKGYANLFRGMTHSAEEFETYYRDSYLAVPAVCKPAGIAKLVSTRNAGWLVAFTNCNSKSPPGVQPIFEGSYLRLLLDGSVRFERQHVLRDYPLPRGKQDYQNMLWWFTDDDALFMPIADSLL